MRFRHLKYKTIYIDSPWPEYGGGKICRGAQKHYKLMSLEEIYSLKNFINVLADDNCHLYLWTTNTFLMQALDIVLYWDFKYVTIITWLKNRIGIGQYFRGLTEHCIFARRGILPYKVINGKRAQGKTGFCASKTIHSEKPEEMRKMIELVSYEPRIELFARKKSEGWDVWGDEIKNGILTLKKENVI